MIDVLVRLLADVDPAAIWTVRTIGAVVGAFVVYVGIAMVATLFTRDPGQRKTRYRIFRDLLDLFRRRPE